MIVTLQPSRLTGAIDAPPSKSSMQRACAAALVARGKSVITNAGHSNDDKAALAIITALGASVRRVPGGWQVTSEGVDPAEAEIDCGESGLSIRMFTPIAALSDAEITVNGSGSLSARPMDFFDDVLPRLGVSVTSTEGKLPLVVQGPLEPADIEVDGSLSSQFLTGLLFAYAAAGASGVSIKVKDLKSKPYIDLTLEVMKQFGLQIPENRNYQEFIFKAAAPGGSEERQYTVEADWSGAAFLLVAGAIAGPITVQGLDLGSTQADRAIVDALMAANAGIAMEAKGIRIHPTAMRGFEFDATECPDLFPPLVALAAHCKGRTTIKGVSRLLHKESNRAEALQDEFDKMGVMIEVSGDEMHIDGRAYVKGADTHSHHDHRIAMACAVAGLKADGPMVIEDAEAVNKSYPNFFDHLKKLGADVSLDNKLTWHE